MIPSGLTNNCVRCSNPMPYDPQAQNQLCHVCNRRLALGYDSYPANDEPRQSYNYQTTASSTSPLAASSYQTTTYSNSPQPTMTPQSYPNTEFSASPQPMMASPSLKRKYEMPGEEQYPIKRPFANAYAPHTPSTLRRNVWPSAFDDVRETIAITTETEDEDGEEFMDAQEDQGWDAQAAGVVGNGEGEVEVESDAEGDIDEDGNEGAVEYEAAASEAGDDEVEEQAVDDEGDLFASVFRNTTNGAVNDSDADDEADDDDQPAETKDFDRSAFIAGLQSTDRTNAATTATNKKKKKPTTPVHAPGSTIPAELPRHLGNNLRKQNSFHIAALEFLPRLSMREGRYWIGVLKVGVNPRASPQSERNFTWMKGNRKTTVETVTRLYEGGAAEEGVVLLVGFERPDLRTRCEELDYFNDKRVIFRAVKEDHKDAGGRGLAEELIKEIIPIEDEEEEEAGVSWGKDGAMGKKKEKEVIVLD